MSVLKGYKDDLKEVLVINYLLGLIGVFPMFWTTRKEIPWKLVLALLPPTLGMGFLGSLALYGVEPTTAKMALGSFLLAFVGWKVRNYDRIATKLVVLADKLLCRSYKN